MIGKTCLKSRGVFTYFLLVRIGLYNFQPFRLELVLVLIELNKLSDCINDAKAG